MAASRSALIALAWLAACALSGGCRTPASTADPAVPVGAVGVALVLPPPGAARMELAATERFVFPRQHEPVVLPVYLAPLLDASPARVEVCVEIDIGADGRVADARRSPDPDCGEPDPDPAFLQAVRQWRFDPAMVCVAPDTTASDACLHPQVRERPTAVRLSYAFRFSKRAGHPVVERVSTGEAPGRQR